MIVLNIIFCLAFLLFAWFNLNDPDAWLWVSIYLLGALCCGAAVFGLYYPLAYVILAVLYLVYACERFFTKDGVWDWMTKYKMPSIAASMQAKKPWIEKTRECFGLMIVAAVLLINYFVYR